MNQRLARARRVVLGASVLFVSSVSSARAQQLLVPMDDGQQNHLKAYGLTYSALKAGMKAEWFLNYRGSFLRPRKYCGSWPKPLIGHLANIPTTPI